MDPHISDPRFITVNLCISTGITELICGYLSLLMDQSCLVLPLRSAKARRGNFGRVVAVKNVRARLEPFHLNCLDRTNGKRPKTSVLYIL